MIITQNSIQNQRKLCVLTLVRNIEDIDMTVYLYT